MSETKVTNRQLDIADGWIPAQESWTYLSANSITVPSGAASKYSAGMRIKLTQTTVKFFVILAVTDTTFTVYGVAGDTVANAAISLNYYSVAKIPLDYPDSLILVGYGMIKPAGAVKLISEAVSFGITFASVPIVMISAGADRLNASGDDYGGTGIATSPVAWNSYSRSVTGFSAYGYILIEANNLDSTYDYYYSWVAIGRPI